MYNGDWGLGIGDWGLGIGHPCAGRHLSKQASIMLPLDLHVLSL